MRLLPFLLVALVACGPRKQTADTLQPQSRVALSVVSTPQGLTAVGILADRSAESGSGGDDQGGVDCQNGLDPSGKPCDGGPAANTDDGAAEGNPDTPAGQVVVPRDMLQASGADYRALGLTIADGARLPDGAAVRFVGSIDSTGRFVTASARPSAATTGRLVGRVQAVSRGPAGELTLRVLGQTVHARASLPLSLVDSVEAASGQDSDGVNCEQSGDAQGDNTACSP